jgi:hypothetical protein
LSAFFIAKKKSDMVRYGLGLVDGGRVVVLDGLWGSSKKEAINGGGSHGSEMKEEGRVCMRMGMREEKERRWKRAPKERVVLQESGAWEKMRERLAKKSSGHGTHMSFQ